MSRNVNQTSQIIEPFITGKLRAKIFPWMTSTDWFLFFFLFPPSILFYFLLLFGCTVLHAGCGILSPLPGIELVPPALRAQSANHWTAGKSPDWFLITVKKALWVLSYILETRAVHTISTAKSWNILSSGISIQFTVIITILVAFLSFWSKIIPSKICNKQIIKSMTSLSNMVQY